MNRQVDTTTGIISSVSTGGMSISDLDVDATGSLYGLINYAVYKLEYPFDGTTAWKIVAGSPSSYGFSGDNGPATQAQLYYPQGIAVDASANVYIADYYIITTVAGNIGWSNVNYWGFWGYCGDTGDGGSATSASLSLPRALAVDSMHKILYIIGSGNNKIRAVSLITGIISTVVGTGSGGFSGDGGAATLATLYNPQRLAVDSRGNLFIADYQNSAIRFVQYSTGIITTIAGGGNSWGSTGDGGLATSAQLSYSQGVAVDEANNRIFIADSNNYIVRTVTVFFGPFLPTSQPSSQPTMFAIGPRNPTSQPTAQPSMQPSTQPSVLPTLYTTRTPTAAPSVFTAGIINRFAGMYGYYYYGDTGDDGLATIAGLGYPLDVCVDSVHDAVYILTNQNHIR